LEYFSVEIKSFNFTTGHLVSYLCRLLTKRTWATCTLQFLVLPCKDVLLSQGFMQSSRHSGI
jgi:hypothetical protein